MSGREYRLLKRKTFSPSSEVVVSEDIVLSDYARCHHVNDVPQMPVASLCYLAGPFEFARLVNRRINPGKSDQVLI